MINIAILPSSIQHVVFVFIRISKPCVWLDAYVASKVTLDFVGRRFNRKELGVELRLAEVRLVSEREVFQAEPTADSGVIQDKPLHQTSGGRGGTLDFLVSWGVCRVEFVVDIAV